MNEADYIKAFRFGFGVPRDGKFDPLAELEHPPAADAAAEKELEDRISFLTAKQQMAKEERQAKMANADSPDAKAGKNKELNQQVQTYHAQDVHQTVLTAVNSDQMFTNRLCAFWSNHFALGATSRFLRVTSGLYEPTAIRPNMFGSFYDLLVAAEFHPTMVMYLNLQESIGPNSKAGMRQKKGLNENLGREILELHTLGVDGGYVQADIIAFSKILTGWHVERDTGQVIFTPNRAEPGSKKMLGKSFGGSDAKEQDAKDALRFLADHPSTARFIAHKLATHFVGPGNADLEKALEAEFKNSKGNLTSIYKVLLAHPSSSTPLGKQTRNDFVFLVSALRASAINPTAFALKTKEDGKPPGNPMTVGSMENLTQKLWAAPSPKGWPDDPGFWLSPTVIGARLRRIPAIVKHYEDEEPTAFAARVLGPLLRPQTLATIKLASNKQLALGLTLASPEFNRS